MVHDLVGTWRLVSLISEDVETGAREDLSGPGYINFGPDGRMYTLTVVAGRPQPTADPPDTEDAATMFRTMVSYAGTYHWDGEELVFDIDIAWNEAWVGRRERRSVRYENGVLELTAPPAVVPWSGRECSRIIVWERI